MEVDAFELNKNSGRTNDNDWLRNTPILQYGVIEKVYDANLVFVRQAVQESISAKKYTVRLLHLSTQLKEESVRPLVGDLVLLLFLRGYKDEMFLDPLEREKNNKGDGKIHATDADNYNMFSGVGIQLSTVKGRSSTTTVYDEDSTGPTVNERTVARVTKIFNRAMSVLFDVPIETSGGNPADEAINVLFGPHSPFTEELHAAVTRKYGYDKAKDGTIVELAAPVTETYSNKAPITKNILGEVDVHIGTDSQNASTTAPVNIDLNDKSPVDVKSKSGLSLSFDKAVLVKYGDKYTIEVTGDMEIKGAGKVKIKGSEIVLNDGVGYVTEFTALKTALTTAFTTVNTLLGTKMDMAGAPGTVVLSMDTAKVTKVRT